MQEQSDWSMNIWGKIEDYLKIGLLLMSRYCRLLQNLMFSGTSEMSETKQSQIKSSAFISTTVTIFAQIQFR